MYIEFVEVKLNFEKMLAGLFYKDELIKTFDLNKKTPGCLVDRFKWEHEDGETIKHEIIIEIGQTVRGMPLPPTFQIYPIAGKYVIHTSPKSCDVRKGTVEDYFSNHKFHEEKED